MTETREQLIAKLRIVDATAALTAAIHAYYRLKSDEELIITVKLPRAMTAAQQRLTHDFTG